MKVEIQINNISMKQKAGLKLGNSAKEKSSRIF